MGQAMKFELTEQDKISLRLGGAYEKFTEHIDQLNNHIDTFGHFLIEDAVRECKKAGLTVEECDEMWQKAKDGAYRSKSGRR